MRRQLELIPQLEIPPAQKRRINRQKHSLEPRFLRPLYQLDTMLPTLKQIQLQHIRIRPTDLRHLLQRLGRKRTQPHRNAHIPARVRGADLAVRVREALHGGRGDAEGGRVFVAEDLDAGV